MKIDKREIVRKKRAGKIGIKIGIKMDTILIKQQRRREKAPNITFIASTQYYIMTTQYG